MTIKLKFKNEGDLVAYIEARVRARKGECIRAACRGRRGFFDLIIWLPGHPAFFVEVKNPLGTGTVSRQQQWWLKRANELGQEAYVVASAKQIDSILSEKDWV